MRAVRFNSYGGPDVLSVTEVERPEAAPGTVLVAVRASGINLFDAKVREGQMEGMVAVAFPSGQGSDLAGVIEAVGDGVEGWAVGDEVLGAAAARGAQAEYALADPGKLVRRPPALSWEAAGAINTVAATAYAMVASIDLQPGQTVLVSGAAGGVGSLVSQLLVAEGIQVIGVASERNHTWLEEHGATPVAYGSGLEARVRARAESPVSAVLDTVGGGYIELGLTLGVEPARIDTIADHAAAAQHDGVQTVGGFAAPMPRALQELTDQIASGKLELRIDRVLPLDEVRAAYEHLEHGHPQGKVVLVP